MIKKLFIGNCDFNVDDAALQSFIESQGIQVSSVQVIKDKYTGSSRGFGFAELAGSEDMANAIDKLNGQELGGRPLTVNEAREQKPRFNSSGGGYGKDSKPRGNGRRPSRW